MNRNTLRGMTAAVIAGGVLSAAAIVGPAIARGADHGPAQDPTMTVAQQRAIMDWKLPDVSRSLRLTHHVRRHRPATASRSTYRAALTGSPMTIGHVLLLRQGWSESQWSCLATLWNRESGWDTYASNGSSGAYGIPQALPGYKMASFGSDWRSNPITQIRWGLWYIANTYGTPCAALDHSYAYGYY